MMCLSTSCMSMWFLTARKTPLTTRKSVHVQRPVVNHQTSTPHLLGEFCYQQGVLLGPSASFGNKRPAVGKRPRGSGTMRLDAVKSATGAWQASLMVGRISRPLHETMEGRRESNFASVKLDGRRGPGGEGFGNEGGEGGTRRNSARKRAMGLQ